MHFNISVYVLGLDIVFTNPYDPPYNFFVWMIAAEENGELHTVYNHDKKAIMNI